MTLLVLLLYLLLGVLLAWPCWLLLRRALNAHRPLRCVRPYHPHLPPSDISDALPPPAP